MNANGCSRSEVMPAALIAAPPTIDQPEPRIQAACVSKSALASFSPHSQARTRTCFWRLGAHRAGSRLPREWSRRSRGQDRRRCWCQPDSRWCVAACWRGRDKSARWSSCRARDRYCRRHARSDDRLATNDRDAPTDVQPRERRRRPRCAIDPQPARWIGPRVTTNKHGLHARRERRV